MSLTKIRGNTQIKAITITDAEIANNANIKLSKIEGGLDLLRPANISNPQNNQFLVYSSTTSSWINKTLTLNDIISDGDKGDITVSNSGNNWVIDNQAVTYNKIQNISSNTILGRSSSGSGVIEEITCTSAGRALLDDSDAAAQRVTLGLGSLATQNGTFSGTSSGTNTGDQTITLTGDVTGTGTSSFSTAISSKAVTFSKIQDISTNTLLGRSSSGSGVIEEITCTSAGRALLDDATSAAQRVTLGLGSLATQNGTFSGTSSGTNTGDQNIFANILVPGQTGISANNIQDNLTFIPGSNVTITTDSGNKSVIISAFGNTYTNENAQDAVGEILSSTTTVEATYNDSLPQIKFDVIPNSSIQKIQVSKNSNLISSRKNINFIEGSNISLSISDDNINDRINLTVSSTATPIIANGDKGDITVSNDGESWTIDNQAVTFAKIQNITADRLLGRSSSGSGVIEQIPLTPFARTILDDVDSISVRTTLGLGTLATQNGTFSGTSSGTNTGDQNVFATITAPGQATITANSTAGVLTIRGTGITSVSTNDITDTITISSTIPDGDKGDVTVSNSGDNWVIDNQAVTFSKIQNISANRILGRSTTGSGSIEEITCTPFSRTLLDDSDASIARATLGLGSLATQDGTFSGNSSGINTGDQNLFSTIAVSGQGSIVADAFSDTLTLVAGSNIQITTNASTDTITISAPSMGDVVGPASSVNNNVALFDGTTGKLIKDSGLTISGTNTGDQNVFSTVAVTGQSSLVADTNSDVLTISPGDHIQISTDASTDTLSIRVHGVGAANGIASLDGAGKVPMSQLPSSIMEYKGLWNASNNTPSLIDGSGNSGDVYRVIVAGSQNLGSGSISFDIGDYVIYNGTIWEKSDTTDAVASVNGKIGVVVLDADDILDFSTTKKFTTASDVARLANTSGTNTGDQNLFNTISVAGQNNVVADTTNDTLTLVAGSNITITTNESTDTITISSTAAGVTNGDKGDITVSNSGNDWVIDNQAVTYSKIQNVSNTDRLLGRFSPGSGSIEEITCTPFARTILDDVDSISVRTTLGLGTLATQNGTFSGTSSGTNTGDQDLSGLVPKTTTVNGQSLSSNITLTTNNISDSTNKRYVTDLDLITLSNTTGTNTGNQNVFSTIAVAGQSNVVADTTSDTLTLVGGTNIAITTNATTDTVTISAVGGGDVVGPASSINNNVVFFDGTTGKLIKDSGLTISGSNTGDQDLSGLVTKTTTVNGQALSSNVTLTTTNIADSLNKRYVTDGDLTKLSNTSGTNTGDQDLSGLVSKTTTINGQALSSNVTLTTADIADSSNKRYVTDSDLTSLSNTSGTNSGDQSVFSSIAVAGQSTVAADSTSDTLTLVAGDNITITTDPSTDAITINSTASGSGDVVGPASSGNNNVAFFDGTTGKIIKDSGITLSGNNTGNQNLFETIQVFNSFNTMVSPSATLPVVAESPGDTLYIYGGTNISLASDPSTDSIIISTVGRATLLDVTNYYVNTATGNDTTGSGTLGSPWKTIQRACNEVATLDCNAKQVTINVAAGTYNEFVSLPNCVGVATDQQMRIIGNTTTPANVTVSGFSATNVAHNWNLNGFRVGTGSGTALGVNAGSISWNNINFASVGASGTHMSLSGAGKIVFGGTGYTISGNAAAHINNIGLSFCNMSNATINIVGTLTMTNYIICNYLSLAWLHASTWNGTGITSLGPRYSLSSCSVVFVSSATPDTYLAKAGSVAGSAVTNAVIF